MHKTMASGGEVGAPRNPMANARRVSFCIAPRVRIRAMCDVDPRISQVRELQVFQLQRVGRPSPESSRRNSDEFQAPLSPGYQV